MLETWRKWIAAFDNACATDDWSALDDFLTEDVVYIVAGLPLDVELRGRDAVIDGFKRSVRGFDRKFDRRGWVGVGVKQLGDTAITARSKGTYELAEHPTLHFAAYGSWYFRGGRISLMTDHYDLAEVDLQETLAWLEAQEGRFDPSYAGQ